MAGKYATVPIDSISEEFFVRTRLNDDHVLHLASLYEAGSKLPALLVARTDGLTHPVVDGRHRLAALKLLNKKSADVEWMDEVNKGALLIRALENNVGGSLPPSNADIIYSIQQMIESGMVPSAIQKQLAEKTKWPPSVLRRYITDALSNIHKSKLVKAKEAVLNQGMTVGEAAMAFKLKLDTLKGSLQGKAKRKSGVAEFKGALTNIFRSRGGSMGAVMKKVQIRLEDGDISWNAVEQILDHCESCCKNTALSVRDWRRRLEAKNGKKDAA